MRRRPFYTLSSWPFALLISLGLVACNSANKPDPLEESVTEISTTETSNQEEANDSAESASIFLPPNPITLVALLNVKDDGLMDNKLADLASITNLNARPEMSLALGIYSADLAFCVLNEQPKIAQEYLGGLKVLMDKSGLSQAVNSETISQRFEANLSNKDSLTNILYSIQEQTNNYLSETDQDDTLVIYFLGAWVETLYISLEGNSEQKASRSFVRLLELSSSLANAMQSHGREIMLYEKCHQLLAAFNESLPLMYDEDYEEYIIDAERLDLKKIQQQIGGLRALILKTQ